MEENRSTLKRNIDKTESNIAKAGKNSETLARELVELEKLSAHNQEVKKKYEDYLAAQRLKGEEDVKIKQGLVQLEQTLAKIQERKERIINEQAQWAEKKKAHEALLSDLHKKAESTHQRLSGN